MVLEDDMLDMYHLFLTYPGRALAESSGCSGFIARVDSIELRQLFENRALQCVYLPHEGSMLRVEKFDPEELSTTTEAKPYRLMPITSPMILYTH